MHQRMSNSGFVYYGLYRRQSGPAAHTNKMEINLGWNTFTLHIKLGGLRVTRCQKLKLGTLDTETEALHHYRVILSELNRVRCGRRGNLTDGYCHCSSV